MKNALLLVIGVGVGFIAAHQFEKTPEGKRFFGDGRRRISPVHRCRRRRLQDPRKRIAYPGKHRGCG